MEDKVKLIWKKYKEIERLNNKCEDKVWWYDYIIN
jgi:hypothetical protein